LHDCPPRPILDLIEFARNVYPLGLLALATILHALTSMLLHHSARLLLEGVRGPWQQLKTYQLHPFSAMYLYWLNPLVIASVLHPLPALGHAISACALYTSLCGLMLASVPLSLCMVWWQPSLLPVLPVYWEYALAYAGAKRHQRPGHVRVALRVTLIAVYVLLVLLQFRDSGFWQDCLASASHGLYGLMRMIERQDTSFLGVSVMAMLLPIKGFALGSASSIQAYIQFEFMRYTDVRSNYTPSVGVLWYLAAQVFGPFRTYFDNLCRVQPFLFMQIMLGYMPTMKFHYAVSMCCIRYQRCR
jgi:hypothetical protein